MAQIIQKQLYNYQKIGIRLFLIFEIKCTENQINQKYG